MSRQPGDLILKDPDSTEPQGFDWSAYLAELGEDVEIDTSTWEVSEGDAAAAPATVLTLENDTIVTGNLKTQVYLIGGTRGKTYRVRNRIVTNSAPPVTDDRSFFVKMQHR